MILAINTATQEHALALISEGQVLAECTWESARDDVERLAPELTALLEKAGRQKSDIQEIVVVKGPGSFTAVRTGVAFANALAVALSASLHSITSFELLAAQSGAELILLHAGGQDIAYEEKGQIHVTPFDEFDAQGRSIHAQIRQEHSLNSLPLTLSFGEVMVKQPLSEAVEQVEVLYLKGPHIQKSKNKWKQ